MGLRPIPLIGERGGGERYSIGGNAEAGNPACAPAEGYPNGWNAGTRHWQSACQRANVLLFCAFPCPASCGKHTRMIGAAEAGRPYVRKKPICRGAYVRPFSANPAPLLLRHPMIDSKMGVWGLAPMFTFCPCLSLMQPSFCPRKRAARLHRSFCALL